MTLEQTPTLAGKTALVTGASSGIGRTTALRLAGAGARILASGRDKGRLEALMREIGPDAEVQAADLAQPSEIAALMKSMVSRQELLDILVINAGVANAPAIGELDLAAYDRLMDVNVRGSVFTFVHALPLLADEASVVFIGSVAGSKGQPGDPLYAGSKGFIRAFARNAGTTPDLMARRIRVNVVSPGPIETALTEGATSNPDIKAYVEGLIPMHRWGRAEEARKQFSSSRPRLLALQRAQRSRSTAAWRIADALVQRGNAQFQPFVRRRRGSGS
jgi:NAD(P)-dependent dehydrogenase (short-subunit alcohol dehydrogenase family)